MNIHTKDDELVKSLFRSTVAEFEVGSTMYGLENKNSDIDYLYIYLEPSLNNSFMWEHHQIQFKQDDIDYNFTTLKSFIRNILSGDSTINFEILFSNELKENYRLGWLYKYRNYFINYNIIKSYLGMAKRDLKYYLKATNNLKKHSIETHKKLSHFVRGVIFAKNIMDNNFSLDLRLTNTIDNDIDDLELLSRIKNGSIDINHELIQYFEDLMNSLREELNDRSNKGSISKFMNTNIMRELDNETQNFINKNIKDGYIDYKDMFYETLENGIKY